MSTINLIIDMTFCEECSSTSTIKNAVVTRFPIPISYYRCKWNAKTNTQEHWVNIPTSYAGAYTMLLDWLRSHGIKFKETAALSHSLTVEMYMDADIFNSVNHHTELRVLKY